MPDTTPQDADRQHPAEQTGPAEPAEPTRPNAQAAPAAPPTADRRPVARTHHGDTFEDPYEWLREKDAPDVRAYLEAENAWTSARTDHLAALRGTLVDEIRTRTQESDLSVPVRQGDWWYVTRTVEGAQYPVHVRIPVDDPKDWTPPVVDPASAPGSAPGEQVLLDQNVEAEGHDFFSLGSFDVSADGGRLLYAVDTEGDERFVLRVRDLASGETTDEIPETFPGAFFTPDGGHLYYTTVDDAWRPDTLWRHRLGTPAADDAKVFHEPDERFWLGAGLTRSKQYVVVEMGSKITSEVWLLEVSPDGEGTFDEPRVVWPRRDGVEYSVEHVILPVEPTPEQQAERDAARAGAGPDGTWHVGGSSHGALLVLHNGGTGEAPENFELALVPESGPRDPEHAITVVPSSAHTRLEDVDAFAGHVVVSYRRDGLARIGVARISHLTGPFAGGTAPWDLAEIPFDQPLFTAQVGSNPEHHQPAVRIGYASFVEPATVYDYVVATGELRELRRQPVLPGPDGRAFDPGEYVQRREWATADDGTQVPVSLVWRKDALGLDQAGTRADAAPLLLYGYGSYETSIDPSFSIPRLSLLDRGVVFAVAHVRGGGELGRSWYEDGKELTKKNTFTDFVAVARHLVGAGWTSPARLVADGRSAGGLLMGAVANLAPELFAGIHAGVPFVDALTSILDPSLPLTVVEWDEWGDPLHDADVYAYMKSYSPYENVREGVRYPRILATTSINDTRVLYVEPAKWTARLREVGADVLLKTEMSAGHGGVSGRYARWQEIAFEDAWLLDVLGLAGDASDDA
ncbi:S9 family peptidase [Luteimicrobium subarcticum]|uniref:Oligopeptidase B n=1 Tax=Luteimicrobium subarcticum TaxID=620910 RepID=A0A2M8WRM2_9MICO|nr:S9 family peptidase [Luteimicrobium subarcticum]PJI93595.1 oligopeptidase B [Luteimicrobium subarcticum]